ncbi:MAG: COG2426 family protein [Acidimicrobiia bacterium]
MRDAIVEWVEGLPAPLAVLFLAILPIIELRGAIPAARSVFDMAPVPAYWWAVLGNLLPVPLILWLLPPVAGWAERHWSWLDRLISRLSSYTERRRSARFERLRDFALVSFVAVPLPVTGAWSGALAAYVFGVPRHRALALIAAGVLISGVIVSIAWAVGLAIFTG